jgi:TPR repeat protein
MEKGNQELESGNISAARLFFEYAADAGLAEAAMALAGTFDASELAKLNVRGIKPDATEARRWYERARQLGAVDAENRVRRLGAQ